MNKLKLKIKQHFDRAYSTYDGNCWVQHDVCHRLLELLTACAPQFDTVADFACGTGESTLKLIDSIDYKQFYAVDFSDKLLQVAINKLPPAIKCICADLEDCLFSVDSLDLIFCNMGLQWAFDLAKTLSLFRGYLTANGYLVFSIPIQGNFQEIKKEFRYPLLENEQIIKALSDNGFNTMKQCIYNQVQPFSSYRDALRSLQKIGANASFASKPFKKMQAGDFFLEECISPALTYHIAMYVCQK